MDVFIIIIDIIMIINSIIILIIIVIIVVIIFDFRGMDLLAFMQAKFNFGGTAIALNKKC